MKPLIIAGREFTSRLFLGTDKFSSNAELSAAIQASGTELVTVALRRVEIGKEGQDEDILAAVPAGVKVMLNTSGARTAEDAVRIGKIARAAGYDWIKLEIHPDPNYLLPDPVETYKAAVELVAMGFTVLPYINADPSSSNNPICRSWSTPGSGCPPTPDTRSNSAPPPCWSTARSRRRAIRRRWPEPSRRRSRLPKPP